MRKYFLSLILFASCYLGVGHSVMATTYYVSASGNDTNPGTSTATAWQSIERVNQAVLKPGDRVLFAATQTFNGSLEAQASGTDAQPIVYSSYGKGAAIIRSNNDRGFLAYNLDGIELRRLTFIGAGRDVNITGGIVFYRDDASQKAVQLQHIILDSLDISGYRSCGITLGSYSAAVDYWGAPFGYDDVRITNTAAHDNGDTGIFSYGATLHAHHNWYVGNCTSYDNSGLAYVTDRNSGSGIVLANVDGATVEQCEAYNNGWLSNHAYTGPAGIWAYASNDVTIQYCEAHHNRSGTLDGGGFDLDGGCTNSVLQYNYSHDNQGPGLMLAQYAGAPVAMENLTIRYNISENDSRQYGGSITLWSSGASGGIKGANIYNNTVYLAPTGNNYVPKSVYIASASIEGTALRNNIFQTTGGVPFLHDMGGTVTLQGNCYWSSGAPSVWQQFSSTFTNMEQWRTSTGAEKINGAPSGLVVDPKLTAPGTGGTRPWGPNKPISSWKAYQLQSSSPLIGAGLDLEAMFGIPSVTRDIYGFVIPSSGASANIGAQGGSSGNPLPVELVSFYAQYKNNQVGLHWATATERNSAFFEIQRSADGKTFATLGKIAAAGNSSTGRTYTWDDPKPLAQTTYYRLRQTDHDGSAHYSAVAVVPPNTIGKQELSVFPNPIKRGQELFLDLAAWSGQSTQLTITSLTGQVALRTQLTAASTPSTVRLPAQLTAGTYLVSMRNGQQEFHARMVVE